MPMPSVRHQSEYAPRAVGAEITGGRAFRARLAAAFGSDRPAAVIEDVITIGGAFLIVAVLP
jgi:uncharacterized membrane protein